MTAFFHCSDQSELLASLVINANIRNRKVYNFFLYVGDAIFQIKIGPVANCIHLWPLAEYNEQMFGINNGTELESIQSALYATIKGLLEDHHCPCTPESIDWVISCDVNSHEVVFKYFLHLNSEHCNCSATEALLTLETWVESSGRVEIGMYRMHVNSTCQPVRVKSLDGPDCLSKKLESL